MRAVERRGKIRIKNPEEGLFRVFDILLIPIRGHKANDVFIPGDGTGPVVIIALSRFLSAMLAVY